MRIKHITLMAGPEGTFQPNTEREVDDALAASLIAGGYAIEVKRRAPEGAVARPRETATTAEQTAAAHLANIASAGQARRATARKKVGGMSPTQEDEAARDAYAGAAPAAGALAPTSDEAPAPTSDESPSADVSTDPAAE